ncbi:MAG: hypothetical protein ACJ72Z_05925 [Pyrinomonadaceae bacterium]
MANAYNMTAEETKLQGILAAYLASRKEIAPETPHLDQDTLAAFAEGTLNERESAPAISHLVGCSYCRHITAELVRLELAFADEPIEARVDGNIEKPAKISEVLNGLFEKIFGSSENAVFAHEEKDKENEKKKDDETK